jgi:hypothetical protein
MYRLVFAVMLVSLLAGCNEVQKSPLNPFSQTTVTPPAVYQAPGTPYYAPQPGTFPAQPPAAGAPGSTLPYNPNGVPATGSGLVRPPGSPSYPPPAGTTPNYSQPNSYVPGATSQKLVPGFRDVVSANNYQAVPSPTIRIANESLQPSNGGTLTASRPDRWKSAE